MSIALELKLRDVERAAHRVIRVIAKSSPQTLALIAR